MAAGSKEAHSGKRDDILAAAQQEFADKGFHTARVEDIAARADVGKGTVYLYFSSKSDLLTALLEDRFAQLGQRIEAVIKEEQSAAEALHECIRAHFDFYNVHSAFIKLLYGHLGQVAANMEAPAKKSIERLTRLVAGVLARGVQAGFLAGFDVHFLTQALQGMIHGVAFELVVTGSQEPPAAAADLVYNLFCQGASAAGSTSCRLI